MLTAVALPTTYWHRRFDLRRQPHKMAPPAFRLAANGGQRRNVVQALDSERPGYFEYDFECGKSNNFQAYDSQ